jgi:hypothetical protein
VPIPRHVPTGTYTIQWRLFGHFDSSGVPNRSLMDYATCLDLKIENPNPSPPPPCPAMVGNNCEHFKGVTDINQMLNGERETGNRKTPSSFVDRGLPARVQQCKANPPKVDPKPQPPQNKPQPQPQPKPEAKPTAKPQPPPPEKAPTSQADEAEVAEKISTLTKQLQSLVTQFNAVEETLSLRSSINKLSNQVQTLTDKFNKIQVAVVKDDNKP